MPESPKRSSHTLKGFLLVEAGLFGLFGIGTCVQGFMISGMSGDNAVSEPSALRTGAIFILVSLLLWGLAVRGEKILSAIRMLWEKIYHRGPFKEQDD